MPIMFEVSFRNNPQNCQQKTGITQSTPGIGVILNEHTHQRTKIYTRMKEILLHVNIYSCCVTSVLFEHYLSITI